MNQHGVTIEAMARQAREQRNTQAGRDAVRRRIRDSFPFGRRLSHAASRGSTLGRSCIGRSGRDA